MAKTLKETVLKLNVEERTELIAALWESFFTGDDAGIPLSEQQIAEIERRDRELDENPEIAIGDTEMRKRLRSLKFKARAQELV